MDGWSSAVRRLLAWGTLLLTLSSGAFVYATSHLMCQEVVLGMSDGARLYGFVNRASPDVPRPVIFTLTPYGGTWCSLPNDQALDADARDDFVQVIVHMRGSGASEGVWDMLGGRTQEDIDELLDWIAAQHWSNGKILLSGRSGPALYIGYGLDHPAVRAAVVFTTCAELFHGCTRPGGGLLKLGPGFVSVAVGNAYVGNMAKRREKGLDQNPPPPLQLAALNQASIELASRDTFDEWYRERDSRDEYARSTVPVYFTTDQYDIIPSSIFDAFLLTRDSRLSTGLGHGTIGLESVDVSAQQLRPPIHRFVRHYLLGEDNGAERAPRVQILTNLGSREGYAVGRAVYRDEPSWPLPDTAWTRLYLGRGPSGSARSLNDGKLVLAPPQDVPDIAQLDALPVAPIPGPKSDMRVDTWRGWPSWSYYQRIAATDLSRDEAGALTYTTPALTRNLEVTGPMALRLFATSTVPDFDWVVRLSDVWPDERSEWVGDGYLRASLRRLDPARSLINDDGEIVRPWHPFTEHELVPVGQIVEYLIEVHPISNVFQAGHRIRLDLFGSGLNAFDSPRAGGSGLVTIQRGTQYPSSLLLPVIPARCHTALPVDPGLEQLAPCARDFAEAL